MMNNFMPKFNIFEETEPFIEKCNLPKMTQEETKSA